MTSTGADEPKTVETPSSPPEASTERTSRFQGPGGLFSSLQTKQLFGNVSNSMNELSQTFQKRAKEIPSSWNSLSQKLQHLPTDIAHLPQNFESERDQFVKNKSNTEKTGRKGSEHVAAWVGFGDYEDILKTKILKLSLDRRNFLIDPPEDATYQFDLGVYGPVAAATLKEDPNLAKMRFELVPKVVKEPAFWHNYFYRVMLVKQSVFDGDNSNRDEIYEEKGNDEPKKDDVLFTFNDDDDDQDLDTTQVSTAYLLLSVIDSDSLANDEPTAVPASKDIASKPPTTKSQTDPGEMEDWEREMREAAGLF